MMLLIVSAPKFIKIEYLTPCFCIRLATRQAQAKERAGGILGVLRLDDSHLSWVERVGSAYADAVAADGVCIDGIADFGGEAQEGRLCLVSQGAMVVLIRGGTLRVGCWLHRVCL